MAKAGFITLYKALPVFSLIRTITPQDTASSKMEPEAQRGQGSPCPLPPGHRVRRWLGWDLNLDWSGCKGRNCHIKPQKCLLWVHNKQAVGSLSSERPEVHGGRRPGGTRPECRGQCSFPGPWGWRETEPGWHREKLGSVASCTGRTSLQPPFNSHPHHHQGVVFQPRLSNLFPPLPGQPDTPTPSPPQTTRQPALPPSWSSRKPAVARQTPPGGNSSLWDGENVLEH